MADSSKKITNILLIVKMIVNLLSLGDEIKKIIQRVENGDDITPEEIAEAKKKMDKAKDRWTKADVNRSMKEGD